MNPEIVLKARLLDAQDANAQLQQLLQQCAGSLGLAEGTSISEMPKLIADLVAASPVEKPE